jgi:hypothetical protein
MHWDYRSGRGPRPVRGRSFILQIKHMPLAVDHLAVLRDRHVDAGVALSIDQLMACGIVSGFSPPCSIVSKRRPAPSIEESCGRLSGVSSANLWVSFMPCPLSFLRPPRVSLRDESNSRTYPLGALYHGTKFAVEGLSEALSYEAAEIGVRVKIIEPGMVATGFSDALDFSNDESLTEYQDMVSKLMAGFEAAQKGASPPEAVAEVVYQAATDGTDQLRYAVGEDAKAMLAARSSQDDATFMQGLRDQFKL